MLGDNPMLGRTCDHIRPGLRRMERGQHVVLYGERRRYSGFPHPAPAHAARITGADLGSRGKIAPSRVLWISRVSGATVAKSASAADLTVLPLMAATGNRRRMLTMESR